MAAERAQGGGGGGATTAVLKVDLDAWRAALERAESALWGAADQTVRDAHADLCVAVATAVPALAVGPARTLIPKP